MTQATDSLPSRSELRPSRALLTPLFLIALFTLAINDQLLKGAGLLPGWLTGKLSDFAGLLVLPVVLAVVFRVRSTLGLTIAQLASVGFLAALQFSPWFEESWTVLVGLVGIPWHNTADPSDMIAIVVLVPVWIWLIPAMRREPENHTQGSGRRLVETLALCASSVVLMATSPAVCENATEKQAVVPHSQAPHYPGDLTGQAVLARIGGSRTVGASSSAGAPPFAPCAETKNNPPTDLTVTIDAARAVTRHVTIDVDESVSTEDCESKVEGTTVTVEAPITISTADGLVQISDTVRIAQSGNGASAGRTVQWTLDYWSDADPIVLRAILERLAVPPARFAGVRVTWSNAADGLNAGHFSLIRDETYEDCAVLAWQEVHEP